MIYLDGDFDHKNTMYLLNLSEHGAGILCEHYMGIEPNSIHILTVIPEEETNIRKFHLQVRSRWVKLNRLRVESGFSIVSHFGEEDFRCYLDYLVRKSNINSQETEKKISSHKRMQIRTYS